MSDIKTLPLDQAQEKMQARADELQRILKQAETPEGLYDHTKVEIDGAKVKSAADLVALIKARNAELDELGKHIEEQRQLKQTAGRLDDLAKARSPFVHPAPGSQAASAQAKSLGARVLEAKAFRDWLAHRNPAGASVVIDDMLPSDFLAKAGAFDTFGRKALMSTTAGYAPESIRLPGIVEAATRPIQLLDIIPLGATSQAAVPYMEETTRTHGAAETAEGAVYAESEFAFAERSVAVAKITDSLPVTDEQLEDAPFVEGYIDNRLGFGVRRRLDQQCLIGNGTAPNIRGILNTTGIQTRAKGTDAAMDAIFKAMTSVRTIGRALPTHLVMHPGDWQEIRLTKTTDGVYIFGSPTEAGPERLWGLPVVQNEVIAEGTALVGSFEPSWITLFERRGIDIQVGYRGDQFVEGTRTVRADMRAALVVFRPAAFHTVTGL